MHLGVLRLAIAASLAVIGSAAPPYPYGSGLAKPLSSSQCFTRYAWGAGLSNTQTTRSTHYTSCTSTLTSTVIRTTSSPPVTITSTLTTTATVTAPANIVTATSTNTTISTTIAALTETNTAISTTTSTTIVTSTIPAASGFIPVQSSLPGADYNDPTSLLKKGISRASLGKDASSDTAPHSDQSILSLEQSLNRFGYPDGINCISYTPGKCGTSVVTITVTTTATGSTVTTTVTYTDTTTTVPFATTTVTDTLVSVLTSTSSTTTTMTIKKTATVTSTISVFAACATNNLANLYTSDDTPQGFTNVGGGNADDFDMFITRTPYECCVSAITYSIGVQTWAFDQRGDENGEHSSGICYIYFASGTNVHTCSQSDGTYFGVLGDADLVLGNGYCGKWNDVHSDR